VKPFVGEPAVRPPVAVAATVPIHNSFATDVVVVVPVGRFVLIAVVEAVASSTLLLANPEYSQMFPTAPNAGGALKLMVTIVAAPEPIEPSQMLPSLWWFPSPANC
jgi:hypothetical protein